MPIILKCFQTNMAIKTSYKKLRRLSILNPQLLNDIIVKFDNLTFNLSVLLLKLTGELKTGLVLVFAGNSVSEK